MRKTDRARNRWTFYYDGKCDLCSTAAGKFSWMNQFAGVTWVPYQTLVAPPRGLSWDDLEQAAYLDTGRVNLYQGFYAVRMLTLRLIPMLLLAPFLWLPGVSSVGETVYRWVAEHRHKFPGIHGTLYSPPPKQTDIRRFKEAYS